MAIFNLNLTHRGMIKTLFPIAIGVTKLIDFKHMNTIKQYILILAAILWATLAMAQQYKVKAELDTNIILLGDQTILHLTLQQPRSKTVFWPSIVDNIGENIEVIDITENDTIPIPGTDLVDIKVNLTITSWDTGIISIPPLPFIYAQINDSTQLTVSTQELKMYIAYLKVDMEKGIADIKPILEAPWTFREALPIILWTLLALAIIALSYYVYYRWKNNKPIIPLPKKPKIPAHIIANKDLDKLKNESLWQNNETKEYYSRLTDIFRTYLENRMHFGAMEMITDEIMKELKKKEIDKELFDETQKILEKSDFVKFAKIQPIESENIEALDWAYKFVQNTKIKAVSTDQKKGGEL